MAENHGAVVILILAPSSQLRLVQLTQQTVLMLLVAVLVAAFYLAIVAIQIVAELVLLIVRPDRIARLVILVRVTFVLLVMPVMI